MRTKAVVAGLMLALALIGFVVSRWSLVAREKASPDAFDLGSVYAGSTVEFHARLLASSHRTPLEALFDRVLPWIPRSLHPTVAAWHPRNFKNQPAAPVDLSALRPVSQAPEFVHIEKTRPRVQASWYEGKPFFEVRMSLDTSRPGDYRGEVRLTLDRRESFLPLRVQVRPAPSGLPWMLVVRTPYHGDATADGSMFHPITRFLSSLPYGVDYGLELPDDLSKYRTILLADGPLVHLTDPAITNLQAFTRGGGRLLIFCNAFMQGSVPKANQLLEPCGLRVVDADYGRNVPVSRIPSDPLTAGVSSLQFFRPSLVQLTDPARARLLAAAAAEDGGFVGIAEQAGGGETIVIGTSLWWKWVRQFDDNAGNLRLLENLLGRPPAPPSSSGTASP